ncbi:MAG: glycosyltransferase family 2 protein [Oscillospiraceae bacterium]|nr:glycosyltransferase family 2 protein [Oscillospiraceae bacterium]
MKSEPFISIVLICYNYAHLLPKALEGIAAQTFTDFEVVFVDNGCTDNSVEVLKAFMKENPAIPVNIVTIEKNIGLANGDNTGAYAAEGKYLLFHDADDWMDPDALEKLAEAAKKTDADRVIGTYRSVNDSGKTVHEQMIAKDPIQWGYTMQQANLFKNSIYKEHSIRIKDSLWVDAEKTLRFAHYAKKVAYVDTPCWNYLVHLDSTSKNKKIHEKMWTPEYSLETLLRNVKDEYADADRTELQLLEYGFMFVYYSYMFQFLRNAPLKEKYAGTDKLRVMMSKYFPDYLSNPYIKKKNGKSFKAKLVVRVCCAAEKMGLMKAVMLLYHIMSKFYYFQAN